MKRALTLAATLLAATVATTAPADARPKSHDPHHCHSQRQLRGDSWSEYSPNIITWDGEGWKTTQQLVTGTMIGWACPDGPGRRTKFYPTDISWCYGWAISADDDGPPYNWFTRTLFNPYAYEPFTVRQVNPPTFGVPDDQSRQNCRTQALSSATSKWLRADEDRDGDTIWPRWQAKVEVVLLGHLNVKFPMRGLHGRAYNSLDPETMTVLGEWKGTAGAGVDA